MAHALPRFSKLLAKFLRSRNLFRSQRTTCAPLAAKLCQLFARRFRVRVSEATLNDRPCLLLLRIRQIELAQRAEPAHHASASHRAAFAHVTESLGSPNSGSWALSLRRGLLSKCNRAESQSEDQAGDHRSRGLDHFVITPLKLSWKPAGPALPNENALNSLDAQPCHEV